MSPANPIVDKAGKAYWDAAWDAGALAQAIDPRQAAIGNYVNRRFHDYFRAAFDSFDTRKLKLLEIGCGNSAWLPYFATEFGFEVWGLDYSNIGCEQEKRILAREGVAGQVICADMFAPPPEMLGAFDVVVSFGVVEHFENTADCVAAITRFLKPSGLIFTMVPNVTGLIGAIQKAVNRPVYDIHQQIVAPALATAHEQAGCRVMNCEYFLSTNFGVCNLNGVALNTIPGFSKRVLLAILTRLSMLAWWWEGRTRPLRAGRLFSPYISCLAKKEGGS
jgi:2-polyprenyl-3-methyl-5-hydroxy-6-metoxy-1,4-benzoquinol methylase